MQLNPIDHIVEVRTALTFVGRGVWWVRERGGGGGGRERGREGRL